MSSAKRTLRRVIREWLGGNAAAPLLLRHCEVCGEKSWRPLSDTVRGVTIDADLPGGKRADAILTDAQGQIELVIQLEGGSKLAEPDRAARGTAARRAARRDSGGRAAALAHAARARDARLALPLRGNAFASRRRRFFSARDRLSDPPAHRRHAVLRARDRRLRALRIFRRHRLRRQRSPPHPPRCGYGAPPARAPSRDSGAGRRPESASPNRGWIVTA